MAVTLSSGLTLVIPSAGDTNWASSITTQAFQKISEHDHTGAGKGALITALAIVDNAFTDAKIRLSNAAWLRALDLAGTNDLNLIRISTGNHTEIASASTKNILLAPSGTNTWHFDANELKYLTGDGQITQKIAKFDNTTTPSSPAAGSVVLYSDSGTLKYKTSGGTVRTLSFS